MIEAIILSVGLAFLLNYSIGKPGSEFSPYEIFSRYTVWLSKRRLERMNLYSQYRNQFNSGGKNRSQLYELRHDIARILYNAAEPYFTWERMAGICIVCTGFWISLIIGILVTGNALQIIENIVISHIIIRVINKII